MIATVTILYFLSSLLSVGCLVFSASSVALNSPMTMILIGPNENCGAISCGIELGFANKAGQYVYGPPTFTYIVPPLNLTVVKPRKVAVTD